MIYQQYPNAYLLFDDDQQGLAAPPTPGQLGGMYAAGKRKQLYRALIEQERGRQLQEQLVRLGTRKLKLAEVEDQWAQQKKHLEQTRQRAVIALVLAEA